MSYQRVYRFLWQLILVTGLTLAATAGLQPAGVAYAATITVNTGFDEDLGDGGAGCSLREAIIAANTDAAYNGCPKGKGSDTISFTPNLPDIVLSGNLPAVTSNITFMGPKAPADTDGAVIVDGASLYRSGFEITTANVRLIRMSFRNGVAATGGAIVQTGSGTLTIDQSTFINNISSADGGAIFLTSTPKLTITKSIFSDNGAGGDGGAIYVLSGLSGVKLIDSNLVNNTAVNGGVLSVTGPLRGSVTISNTLVVNNSASFLGGLLHNGSSGSAFALTISKSSAFLDNHAHYGGVVYVNNGIVTKLSVSDSSFTDNDATSQGGVFRLETLGAVSVKAASFDSNTAGENGGVILVDTLTGSMSLSRSNFTGNEAVFGFGGVFYADSVATTARSIQIAGGNFANNRATGGSGGVLTAFDFLGSVKISGAHFDGNYADASGGVVFLADSNLKSLTITRSTFIRNGAGGGYGGVIDLGVPGNYSGMASRVTISKTEFTNNVAGTSGGALYFLTLGSLSIGSSVFNINVTSGDGGALNIAELTRPAKVSGSTFSQNAVTSGRGGAINIDNASLNQFTIVKTTFASNNAALGGAIFADDAVMKISGSLFKLNRAGIAGGALYTQGPASSLSVTSSTFVANNAINGGGAVLADGTFLTMTKNLLWLNTAPTASGGAVYFDAGVLHTNCFESNGPISVFDNIGGNDVTGNWWNDPGGPNQGAADTYFTFGPNFSDPWLHVRPSCPPRPAP